MAVRQWVGGHCTTCDKTCRDYNGFIQHRCKQPTPLRLQPKKPVTYTASELMQLPIALNPHYPFLYPYTEDEVKTPFNPPTSAAFSPSPLSTSTLPAPEQKLAKNAPVQKKKDNNTNNNSNNSTNNLSSITKANNNSNNHNTNNSFDHLNAMTGSSRGRGQHFLDPRPGESWAQSYQALGGGVQYGQAQYAHDSGFQPSSRSPDPYAYRAPSAPAAAGSSTLSASSAAFVSRFSSNSEGEAYSYRFPQQQPHEHEAAQYDPYAGPLYTQHAAFPQQHSQFEQQQQQQQHSKFKQNSKAAPAVTVPVPKFQAQEPKAGLKLPNNSPQAPRQELKNLGPATHNVQVFHPGGSKPETDAATQPAHHQPNHTTIHTQTPPSTSQTSSPNFSHNASHTPPHPAHSVQTARTPQRASQPHHQALLQTPNTTPGPTATPQEARVPRVVVSPPREFMDGKCSGCGKTCSDQASFSHHHCRPVPQRETRALPGSLVAKVSRVSLDDKNEPHVAPSPAAHAPSFAAPPATTTNATTNTNPATVANTTATTTTTATTIPSTAMNTTIATATTTSPPASAPLLPDTAKSILDGPAKPRTAGGSSFNSRPLAQRVPQHILQQNQLQQQYLHQQPFPSTAQLQYLQRQQLIQQQALVQQQLRARRPQAFPQAQAFAQPQVLVVQPRPQPQVKVFKPSAGPQ